jgi:hypothetical protein
VLDREPLSGARVKHSTSSPSSCMNATMDIGTEQQREARKV